MSVEDEKKVTEQAGQPPVVDDKVVVDVVETFDPDEAAALLDKGAETPDDTVEPTNASTEEPDLAAQPQEALPVVETSVARPGLRFGRWYRCYKRSTSMGLNVGFPVAVAAETTNGVFLRNTAGDRSALLWGGNAGASTPPALLGGSYELKLEDDQTVIDAWTAGAQTAFLTLVPS